jgi:hypothetical protein
MNVGGRGRGLVCCIIPEFAWMNLGKQDNSAGIAASELGLQARASQVPLLHNIQ